MADFRKMYFKMTGKMADVVETLQKLTYEMIEITQLCEELYMSSDETPIEIAKHDDD